jgi:hypothetical protein
VNEEEMLHRTQEALERSGVQDTLVAAGMFMPRGHFGGAFAGGLVGDSLLGGGVGSAGGALAGMKAVDAASPMPERCFVGVSESRVYGFDTERDHGRAPTEMVFNVARETLEVKVYQRFNVRVLEMIDGPSGGAIELEGPRLPGFHAGNVFHALVV